jgi:hypothetical protein
MKLFERYGKRIVATSQPISGHCKAFSEVQSLINIFESEIAPGKLKWGLDIHSLRLIAALQLYARSNERFHSKSFIHRCLLPFVFSANARPATFHLFQFAQNARSVPIAYKPILVALFRRRRLIN